MSRKRGVLGAVSVLLVLGLGGWRLLAARESVLATASAGSVVEAPLSRPTLIAHGRYLATVGDCVACHTEQGGRPYAGGRMLPTPFGNIPSPNITPDPVTGIGRWTFADFWRAMHTGKGARGELLYPVFSYTSYTKVRREDALAIFAYLRSLTPVNHPRKPLGLRFPYNLRSSLAAWRALYFNEGVYQPDPDRSVAWNRGAYLVQGLGHCNECHAPRNRFGAMPRNPRLSGGADTDPGLVCTESEYAGRRRSAGLEHAGHCRPAQDRAFRQGQRIWSDVRRGGAQHPIHA